MRSNPVGTGPVKVVECKRNEVVKLARNPDYWKKGRPDLHAIEVRVIASRSTRILAFVSGEFDMTYDTDVSIPLMKDVQSQAPKAICQLRPTGVYVNLLVNSEAAPFNDPKPRHAMALAIDRKSFDDILGEGKLGISGAMQPLPEGAWGMPEEMLRSLPGYGKDVEKNLADARAIMQGLGYGPDKPLKLKVSTRETVTANWIMNYFPALLDAAPLHHYQPSDDTVAALRNAGFANVKKRVIHYTDTIDGSFQALKHRLADLYVAVGIFGWITYCRLVRGETLIARNLERGGKIAPRAFPDGLIAITDILVPRG